MTILQTSVWRKWAPDRMTFLSGVLIVLSFPPWNLWPLIWIALVPWFIAIKKAPHPQAACLQGFWLSYFMSLGGFYWIAFVLKEFGGIPWILAILGQQAFSFFNQPQFFILAPILKILSPQRKYWNSVLAAILFALAYSGIDWILPKLFLDTLGHAFYKAKHLRQIADIGGATLLTFLVYLVNESIWIIWDEWKQTKRVRLTLQFFVALGICLVGWGYGIYRYQYVTQKIENSHRGIQIAAVQGNIGDFDKIAAERGLRGAAVKVLDTFMQLSDQAIGLQPKPDILVWPETSYPSTFRTPHSSTEALLDQQLESYVKKTGIPLFFGGYDHQGMKDYNSFFFLSPQGDLQIYHKNILLLFGEYIPGAESIQMIKDMFPQVGNFGRGPGPEVLNIPISDPKIGSIRVGPIICYEALFPNFTAEIARKDGQFILNITNDSWFGAWAEPKLHLALTTFRSVETRLPMLRSTNTGISTLITSDGEITHATEIGTQEILNVHVPFIEPIPTLIKLWGDWFGPFALVIGVSGILVLWLRSSRKTSSI